MTDKRELTSYGGQRYKHMMYMHCNNCPHNRSPTIEPQQVSIFQDPTIQVGWGWGWGVGVGVGVGVGGDFETK